MDNLNPSHHNHFSPLPTTTGTTTVATITAWLPPGSMAHEIPPPPSPELPLDQVWGATNPSLHAPSPSFFLTRPFASDHRHGDLIQHRYCLTHQSEESPTGLFIDHLGVKGGGPCPFGGKSISNSAHLSDVELEHFSNHPNKPDDMEINRTEKEQGEEEEEDEELGAMKEMMYRIAAMQPVEIDPATIRKPKRRNVRISSEPQSVAARHRRERISEKIRILQRLVPGGTKMDTASMLDEAVRYLKFLKRQIRQLQSTSSSTCTNQHLPSVSFPADWTGHVGPNPPPSMDAGSSKLREGFP